MSSYDCMDLCRLCLVKDRVSVPIFEGEGDVRQIFLKIAACLPVKVGRDDKLPKKICDDCVYKVELLYDFWNTTANAEKQLLQWLGEDGEDKQGYVSSVMNSELMKQETAENRLDSSAMQTEEHQNNMNMNMMDQMGLTMPIIMSTDQQQITSVPMASSGNNIQAVPGTSSQSSRGRKSGNNEDEEEESEEEENSDDECDNDGGINVKEEAPDTGRNVEPSFVNVSIPCDEAGPSGLQQQKLTEMPEMVMAQSSEGDPKSGIHTGIISEESKENIEPVHSSGQSTSDKQNIQELIKRENMNPVVLLSDIFTHWDHDEELRTLDELPLSKRKVLGEFSRNIKVKRERIDISSKIPATLSKLKREDEEIVDVYDNMLSPDIDIKLEMSEDEWTPQMSSNPRRTKKRRNLELESKNPVIAAERQKTIDSSEGKIENRVETSSESQREELQIFSPPPGDRTPPRVPTPTPPTPPVESLPCSPSKAATRKRRNSTKKTSLDEIFLEDYENIMPGDLDARALSSEDEWAPGIPLSPQKTYKTHRSLAITQKPRRKSLKGFECDECKRVLCSKQSLMNHIDRKHLNNFLTYYCLYCEFKTTHNSSLRNHMARKHGNQSYECNYCKKKFCSKHDVRVHIGIHTCSPQTCQVCGTVCKNEATLRKHIHKMHTQKFFECDVKGCNKSFISEVRFNNHKMKHSDTFECNFSCGECNTKFPTNQMLNYHLESVDHLRRHHWTKRRRDNPSNNK